jgi:hypothetical protein
MQLSPELEPGHNPPAAPPRPPPRREGSNELKPAPAFRITAGGTQYRRPRPGSVGDLDPDHAVPYPDRDRDRLPSSARAGVPDRITEGLADQQFSVIPARVPGAEHRAYERTGGTGPLRPPRKRHGLPDPYPSHQRTRLPGRPRPGKSRGPPGGHNGYTPDSAPRVKPAHAPARPVRAVRGNADGYTDRPTGPKPVRYASVDPATQRPTALQGDTPRDREETPR